MVWKTWFGILLYNTAKILYKMCYSIPSCIFLITRESADEQRLVLVSAHSPPKKYSSLKLEYLDPQICYIPSQCENERYLPYII